MKRFLLLNNSLYILLKTDFLKKERKEKGKRKETKKQVKANRQDNSSQAVKTIKLYHAGNMRGKMLNVIKRLADIYNQI